MNKGLINDAIDATQECLSRYWQLDPEFVLERCDDDVTWIGSVQSQFMAGKDAVAEDLRSSMEELKPCHLVAQEFSVAQNCGKACTIVGRYLTTTDDEVEYFLQVQQRCTFVWEKVDDDLRIKHMHVSNPMGELKVAEGELFVNELGEHAHRYLMNHMSAALDERRLIAFGSGDKTYFLAPSEVVFVKAQGRHCLVRTAEGQDLLARLSISEFLAAAGEGFVSIHRSYAVNGAYVSCVQRLEAVMSDGTHIPIPQKRYIEVREALVALHEGRLEAEP